MFPKLKEWIKLLFDELQSTEVCFILSKQELVTIA